MVITGLIILFWFLACAVYAFVAWKKAELTCNKISECTDGRFDCQFKNDCKILDNYIIKNK